jgi:transposase
VVADAAGLPLAVHIESAWRLTRRPHEVTLVHDTLQARFVEGTPQRLIGDKAYDSDPLDASLKAQGIEMIAPHRANRRKPKTQDGRKLRRYKRRWKVERLIGWLQNCRRVAVRYERHACNFLGFVKLACVCILLRAFMR